MILPRERRQLVLEERHLLLEGGDLGIALDEDGGGPIPTAAASTYAADAAEAAVGHAPRALGGVGPGRDDFDLIYLHLQYRHNRYM